MPHPRCGSVRALGVISSFCRCMLGKNMEHGRIILLLSVWALVSCACAGSFYDDFEVTWGYWRANVLDNGGVVSLSLDRSSGSGFESKKEYLFGRVDMELKLVHGNSAGTVATFYMSSQSAGSDHYEIDFEFLGNVSGQPYTIQTNLYAKGNGNKEQQFRPWFDPVADFHTYSILWSPRHIIFEVDGIPIRQFKNEESVGAPFPKSNAMKIYSSLWDAENWATQGGRVKTDWSLAPFTAYYRGFSVGAACVWADGASSCGPYGGGAGGAGRDLDPAAQRKLQLMRQSYMIYDYCGDRGRFPGGFPPECSIS